MQESAWARLPLRRKPNYYFRFTFNRPGNPLKITAVIPCVRVAIGDSSAAEHRQWRSSYQIGIIVHVGTNLTYTESNVSVILTSLRTMVPLNQTRLNKYPDRRRVCIP